MKKISIFWFRRDLRLEDNKALWNALSGDVPVLPVFIFDTTILNELDKEDARVHFIHEELHKIHQKLASYGSGLLTFHGTPERVFQQLIKSYSVHSVFANKDFEPKTRARDEKITRLLNENGVSFHLSTDHLIFEPGSVLKMDGTPYTVYTPFKKAWLFKFDQRLLEASPSETSKNYLSHSTHFPSLDELGFKGSSIKVHPFTLSVVARYKEQRDFPDLNATSYLGPHLRFGTVSVRKIILAIHEEEDPTFLSELIWREFFAHILYHFPAVETNNFRSKYNGIEWENNPEHLERWKKGQTGYPIVDAGMRQLRETGYMHNRVRMITASFLCKHLLIDWREGERHFARHLLDFELASNNGNWQWCAGTGCDAAPYFRIFNPYEQTKKFDSKLNYIRTWVPELESFDYPSPVVDHAFARQRALDRYKLGISSSVI